MSYTFPFTGRRREDLVLESPKSHDQFIPDDMQGGDYWRVKDGPDHWTWYVYIPGGPVGAISLHHVEEHEDGTITVVPGPWGSNSIPGRHFHGWIKRGVWVTEP